MVDLSQREDIAAMSRRHLEAVVAIESSSDERSSTVPSTEGQRVLSRYLEEFFAGLGCQVTLDEHANVIARRPGRGAHADRSPLALMIHLDTARGTEPRKGLNLLPAWDGSPIPYPDNDRLQVTVDNYPSTARYLGHDLLFGSGRAPFGLDDKLGLCHMMTLARLLADDPTIEHRPLLFIGRPDEEIGREEALVGLAQWLAEQGVDSGYTVDGLDPFEVNVENFNGRAGVVRFADREPSGPSPTGGHVVDVTLLGVNTHGATAKAEGHRGALRWAGELVESLPDGSAVALDFHSDQKRDCDGVLRLWLGHDARDALEPALRRLVGPAVARGAGWSVAAVEDFDPAGAHHRGAVQAALAFMAGFMRSEGVHPILCEDSDGFDGYTHPYRAHPTDAGVVVDVRIRDFDRDGLQARCDHLTGFVKASCRGAEVEIVEQYGNMGPKLAGRADLLADALAAAEAVGVHAERSPIRGGTGVDPFLERGVYVANLGTGYFAPESEKEFTSMQLLAEHALWLLALVQR